MACIRPKESLRHITDAVDLLHTPTMRVYLLLTVCSVAAAQRQLGDYYTSIPVYRTGRGSNIVPVGFGTPEQQFNLTLSTLLRWMS